MFPYLSSTPDVVGVSVHIAKVTMKSSYVSGVDPGGSPHDVTRVHECKTP